MGNFKINCRRAALLFCGWTLVSIIFAGISYAAAIGENNKEFGFVSALRLNLVQFYLWAILTPLVFRFSRRFPIELRPLNVRNLLLYFPALISFAGIHQVIHLAVRLLSLGATERTNVQDVGEGIRVATVLDPFDNVFGVIENPHFKPESGERGRFKL